MAKKQKQPTKTCADCIHESACRIWTDGRFISDASASVCPNHETVKESGAYLCGVLDERNRKKTHGDQIRAMSDKELANLLASKMANIRELEMAEKGIRVTATQLSLLASRLRDIWLQWLRQPAED